MKQKARELGNQGIQAKAALLLAPLLAPVEAFAAGAGPSGGLETLIWPAANFFLYLCGVIYIYKKYITPVLRARKHAIEEHLGSSDKALRQALAEVEVLEQRLSTIDTETAEIAAQYKKDTERLEENIIAEAKNDAQNIREDAVRRSESEYKQAVFEIRKKIVEQATVKAEAQLKNEITPERDAQLRQHSVRGLFQ